MERLLYPSLGKLEEEVFDFSFLPFVDCKMFVEKNQWFTCDFYRKELGHYFKSEDQGTPVSISVQQMRSKPSEDFTLEEYNYSSEEIRQSFREREIKMNEHREFMDLYQYLQDSNRKYVLVV